MTAGRYFLLAGEPSGDRLGGGLMAALKRLDPGAEFMGIGGSSMAEQGLESEFPIEDISVMGIGEVLPRLPRLLARASQAAKAVERAAPDALITIDSPDFCLRVARKARDALPDTVNIHYVCPTIWAWRAGRALKLARAVDHVLALFPFEPRHLESAGIGCSFVGHPVATAELPSDSAAASAKEALGIPRDHRLIVALPGSRVSEVARLAPVFGRALDQLVRRRSDVSVAVAAAGPVAGQVKKLVAGWDTGPALLDPRGFSDEQAGRMRMELFRAADVALAASGTVSLELASAGVPMVVAYDMNWITRAILWRMVTVDTATLVNLINGNHDIPECLGPDCRPDRIAAALERLLDDGGARDTQRRACDSAMDALGRGGESPSARAAAAVLNCLGGRK